MAAALFRGKSRSRRSLIPVKASQDVKMAAGTVHEHVHSSPADGVDPDQSDMQRHKAVPETNSSSSPDTGSKYNSLCRRFVHAIVHPAPCGLLSRLSSAQLLALQEAVLWHTTPEHENREYFHRRSTADGAAANRKKRGIAGDLAALVAEQCYERCELWTHAECLSFVQYVATEAIMLKFSAAELREICKKLGMQVPKRRTKVENVVQIRQLLQPHLDDSPASVAARDSEDVQATGASTHALQDIGTVCIANCAVLTHPFGVHHTTCAGLETVAE